MRLLFPLILLLALTGCSSPTALPPRTHLFHDAPALASNTTTFTSAPFSAPRGFREALLSFNAHVPPSEGLLVELRVHHATSNFTSPWLTLAQWGNTTTLTHTPIREFANSDNTLSGKVDVDYFTSPHLFSSLQYRLTATSPAVSVSRVDITLDIDDGRALSHWTIRDTRRAPHRVGRIPIPFVSQKTPNPDLAGRLCSPTSVTMVLAHHLGPAAPTLDRVADTCLDPDFNIYGNWPRNVQTAFSFGVPAYLTRIESWSQVADLFAKGQPIIASIRTSKGELANAPYQSTSGHLIVLCGFDEHGDVFVNDPAASTSATGQLTYRRQDLTNVWLSRTGGTCYILLPPSTQP